MRITVTSDIDAVVRGLTDLQRKQLPFAAALALTRTAQSVEKRLIGEINSVFDSPSPFIARRSTFTDSAKKSNLEATVGMKDRSKSPGRGASPATYVKEHFSGGLRGQKPFELVLRRIGALPDGWKAMPGEGLTLDRFGNPNRKQLAEVIGAIRTQMQVHAGRGKRRDVRGYFIVTPGAKPARALHLAPGIWLRYGMGRRVQPVFVFVPQAEYSKSIDLEGIAARTVNAEFGGQFNAALAKALASAR